MRPKNKRDEIFENLSSVGSSQDNRFISEYGFYLLGNISNVYPNLNKEVLDGFYKAWIYENNDGTRIAMIDDLNGYISFLCEGTEQALQNCFNECEEDKQ